MRQSIEQHLAIRATPARERWITDAAAFFEKHGPSSYYSDHESPEQGAARGALQLAQAELYALDHGWTVDWQDDDEGIDHVKSFDGYDHEPETCEQATLYDDEGNVLASLGCVDDADDDYRRVVAAQLAQEAAPHLHHNGNPEHMASPKPSDIVTCGTCALQWCAVCDPAPSARCHNEYDHAEPEDDDDDEDSVLDVLDELTIETTRADDDTLTYVIGHPHGRHVIAIEHDMARVAVYWHHPEDGRPAYLVVDVDSEGDEPDLRVYVNDSAVAGFGAGQAGA